MDQLNKSELEFIEEYIQSRDIINSYAKVFKIDIKDVSNIPFCLNAGEELLTRPEVKTYLASRKLNQIISNDTKEISKELWDVITYLKNNPHKESHRLIISALDKLIKLRLVESQIDNKDQDDNLTFEIKL